MKSVKYIVGAPVIILLIFLSGSIFIPSKFFVEKTVFVEVSDTSAFKYAADYKLNDKWNPYYTREPLTSCVVSGTPGASDYAFSLQGKEQGKVRVEFINTLPFKAIYQKVTLNTPVSGTYDNNIYFSSQYKGTFVTWTFSGENKNLIEKWASLFYDETIGEDFQAGLDKLKEELEKEQFSHYIPHQKPRPNVQPSKL